MQVAGDDAAVIEGLRRMSDLLTEVLAQPDGTAALGVLLRYILATHEHIDREKLKRTVVEAQSDRAGGHVVTVYEQLIEEGRQEGRVEGLIEGLLELLVARFGEVPPDVQKRIQQASADELTAWLPRVLSAATAEEVLGPVRRARAPRRSPPARR